jgi:hypothetical protein
MFTFLSQELDRKHCSIMSGKGIQYENAGCVEQLPSDRAACLNETS